MAQITGTLRAPDGTPIVGGRVRADDLVIGGCMGDAVTDGRGAFTLRAALPAFWASRTPYSIRVIAAVTSTGTVMQDLVL
ncbi:peptidase associated/transthyretin-like domain-containing protein [Mariniluteicoccus flavus]